MIIHLYSAVSQHYGHIYCALHITVSMRTVTNKIEQTISVRTVTNKIEQTAKRDYKKYQK